MTTKKQLFAISIGASIAALGLALILYLLNRQTGMASTIAGPIVLVEGQDGVPQVLVVDATSVYWTNDNIGTVMKVPLGGGSPKTLVAGQSRPFDLAVDSTNVYWANYDDGTLMTMALDGGSSTTLVSDQSSPIVAIAIDATNVYWANEFHSVGKVPLAGGTPTTLASGDFHPLAIAIDAAHLYWTNIDSSGGVTVMKVPLGGGTVTTIASSPLSAKTLGERIFQAVLEHPERDAAMVIAIDATSIYWTSGVAVMTVPLGGGTPTTLASGYRAQAIAIDATSIYWTEWGVHGDGAVMKLPLHGGKVTTLASGQRYPKAIAVDASSVYWTSSHADGTGTITKLTPK